MFGDIDLRAFRALNIRESQKGSRQPSQSAYVRAYSSCFGEERRYIVGPGGDAWYKLRSGRYQMGAEKILVFQGLREVIGSCMLRQDSMGSVSLSLSLRGRDYEISMASGKAKHTKGMDSARSPFFMQLAGHGLSFSLWDSAERKKVAETASLFSEFGWMPANQDIHFTEMPEDGPHTELALVALASLSFSWSSGGFVLGESR